MVDFSIGYEETNGTCHMSGSNKFSQEEIMAFLKHFKKRHNCDIPHTDLIIKLVSGQPLNPPEEEIIKQTVGLTESFKDFIDYLNAFRAKKYQHTLRPGCFEIAEKLRKIAAQIMTQPRNQYKIGQLLSPISKVEMPKCDSPLPIKIEDILKAVQKTNYTNHQTADYEDFKSRATWNKVDDFEIKYNPEKEKILFGSSRQDWYIIVAGGKPVSVEKERLLDRRGYGYVLLLENGDKYIFYTVGGEFGQLLKYDFIPQQMLQEVS